MARSPIGAVAVPSLRRLAAFVVTAALVVPQLAAAQSKPKPERRGHKLSVRVDSVPPGATVYVDDKAYGPEGYTPSTVKLPKGVYKIILELQGYKPMERALEIQRSQAFVFTLEKQAVPAVLDVRSAADASAQGASITVDGAAVGTVPNRIEVAAGGHLIEIRKPGFVDYRDNLQVSDGETRTVVVSLPAAVKPGSVLVTADVAGADVYVDGVKRDTAPAVIDGLTEGGHTVEVRKDGAPAWKQLVTVVGGQQVKVQATLTPAAPAVGSLKVLSGAPQGEVFVDGDDKGPVNAQIQNLQPGSHIVEVRAPGFDAKRMEVQVASGEVKVVQVDLSATVQVKQLSGLRVISPVPDAEVFVDGASVGKAPIDRSDLQPGHHFVVVRAPGYAEFKQEIDLDPAKTFQISADLRASGSLRVLSNINGADVILDGTAVGKTPATVDNVSVGPHVLELKNQGYLDGRQDVVVQGGQQQIVQLDLQAMHTGPTTAELEQAQREQSSLGATTIDRFKFNVDLSTGYPYFVNLAIRTGVFRQGTLGGDVAIELRSNVYSTEVGLRPRLQFFRADPLALAVDAAFYAGGGPVSRDSFSFEVGPIATLLAGKYVRISFKPYLQVYTDRLCPTVGNIRDDDMNTGKPSGMPTHGSGNVYQGGTLDSTGKFSPGGEFSVEHPVCKERDATRTNPNPAYTLDPTTSLQIQKQYGGTVPTANIGNTDPRGRFDGARFMLRGVIELLASQNFNLWALFEGAPLQDQRRMFTSKWNNAYQDNDFLMYFQVGATLKF